MECLRLAEGAVLEALAPFCDKDSLQDPEISFFEGGLELDSISFLDLIIEVEGKLGLRLRSEDLTGDAVQTVGGLVRHIATIMSKWDGSA